MAAVQLGYPDWISFSLVTYYLHRHGPRRPRRPRMCVS